MECDDFNQIIEKRNSKVFLFPNNIYGSCNILVLGLRFLLLVLTTVL